MRIGEASLHRFAYSEISGVPSFQVAVSASSLP